GSSKPPIRGRYARSGVIYAADEVPCIKDMNHLVSSSMAPLHHDKDISFVPVFSIQKQHQQSSILRGCITPLLTLNYSRRHASGRFPPTAILKLQKYHFLSTWNNVSVVFCHSSGQDAVKDVLIDFKPRRTEQQFHGMITDKV
ncbi:hypothetical protein J6590_010775, partial [Homalodisca vitripennis]